MGDGAAAAARDQAAEPRETANTSGSPDTTVRVAPQRRHDTGEIARLIAKISGNPYMMARRSTRMGADHGTIERVVRDISGNTEATPQGTPSSGAEHRAANLRTPNTSRDPDMMAPVRADTSGVTDTMVMETDEARGNTYGSAGETLSPRSALPRADEGSSRAVMDTTDGAELHMLLLPCQARAH